MPNFETSFLPLPRIRIIAGALAFKKLTLFIDHATVLQKHYRWRFRMQFVTVSPKYQIVIPKSIRETLQLRPGQKLQVIEFDGRIELIPDMDIKMLHGFLKGINTEFKREDDRL